MGIKHENEQVNRIMAGIYDGCDRYGRTVIREADHCNRSAVALYNKVAVDSPLSLGKLITDEPYKDIAERYVFDVAFDMMHNSVRNVYDGKISKNDGEFRQDEESVTEINKRTYPSHICWLKSKPGMDVVTGIGYADPADETRAISESLSRDRETRKRAFNKLVNWKDVEIRRCTLNRLAGDGDDLIPPYPDGLTEDEKWQFWKEYIKNKEELKKRHHEAEDAFWEAD